MKPVKHELRDRMLDLRQEIAELKLDRKMLITSGLQQHEIAEELEDIDSDLQEILKEYESVKCALTEINSLDY